MDSSRYKSPSQFRSEKYPVPHDGAFKTGVVFHSYPGPNIVSHQLCRTRIGFMPSFLFTHLLPVAFEPTRIGMEMKGVGRMRRKGRWTSFLRCVVVRWPNTLWDSDCYLKPTFLLGVFRDPSGTFTGNSPFCSCGEFCFFQLWLCLPQSLFSKVLPIDLRWSSWEEFKSAPCQLDLQIHQINCTSFVSNEQAKQFN